MAELTLRLEVDPTTQQKRLLIGLESDPDALPMEHEDDHQALVDRLLEAGLIGDGVGQLVIERGERRTVVELDKDVEQTKRQTETNAG
jgi:hypothetical protein